MKYAIINILAALFFITFSHRINSEDLCRDYLLLDGSETLVNYGLDTTGHWWAVTAPFTGKLRLTIDGISSEVFDSLQNLVFSPDGKKWACFAKSTVQWQIIKNDSTVFLPNGAYPGYIAFSNNSECLFYSYYETNQTYIVTPGRKISILNFSGRFHISYGGERLAFILSRGDRYVLNINGMETPVYDSIIPAGFRYDGSFLYAALNGELWEIFKDRTSLSEQYRSVRELKINAEGTVAAALTVRTNGDYVAVLFSDEYYEPLYGRKYDIISALTLHPYLALVGYVARSDNQEKVVLNKSEYYEGTSGDNPKFTFDGSELFFVGCDLNCFASINGKIFKINDNMDPLGDYAMKPGSNTIAYSNNTTMVIRFLASNRIHAGMMVDYIKPPRYNRRTDRYEALGEINDRLYMLTCRI